ncbi:uncharacterized protein LOC144352211 [Saccoglossus kowalevskii]
MAFASKRVFCASISILAGAIALTAAAMAFGIFECDLYAWSKLGTVYYAPYWTAGWGLLTGMVGAVASRKPPVNSAIFIIFSTILLLASAGCCVLMAMSAYGLFGETLTECFIIYSVNAALSLYLFLNAMCVPCLACACCQDEQEQAMLQNPRPSKNKVQPAPASIPREPPQNQPTTNQGAFMMTPIQ